VSGLGRMCSRLVVTTAHHCSTFLKLRLEHLIDIILDIIGQPALSASRRCGSWFLMCSLGVAPVLMQTGALGASMLTLAHPDGLFFLGWLVPALSSSNQRLCSKKSPPNEPKPNQNGVRTQPRPSPAGPSRGNPRPPHILRCILSRARVRGILREIASLSLLSFFLSSFFSPLLPLA